MVSLAGRAAIITGASQGLGLAIARAFVEAGADVLLCARDGEMLEQARASVAQVPGSQKVLAEPADISRAADVARLMAAAQAGLGHLHILVNNAGVYGPKGLIEEVDLDEWMRAIEVN